MVSLNLLKRPRKENQVSSSSNFSNYFSDFESSWSSFASEKSEFIKELRFSQESSLKYGCAGVSSFVAFPAWLSFQASEMDFSKAWVIAVSFTVAFTELEGFGSWHGALSGIAYGSSFRALESTLHFCVKLFVWNTLLDIMRQIRRDAKVYSLPRIWITRAPTTLTCLFHPDICFFVRFSCEFF